jgi:hypothetical protein
MFVRMPLKPNCIRERMEFNFINEIKLYGKVCRQPHVLTALASRKYSSLSFE